MFIVPITEQFKRKVIDAVAGVSEFPRLDAEFKINRFEKIHSFIQHHISQIDSSFTPKGINIPYASAYGGVEAVICQAIYGVLPILVSEGEAKPYQHAYQTLQLMKDKNIPTEGIQVDYLNAHNINAYQQGANLSIIRNPSTHWENGKEDLVAALRSAASNAQQGDFIVLTSYGDNQRHKYTEIMSEAIQGVAEIN